MEAAGRNASKKIIKSRVPVPILVHALAGTDEFFLVHVRLDVVKPSVSD